MTDILPLETKSKGPNFALFVSLYLVILAFFILLHSISIQNKPRQDIVIESVNTTFTSHLPSASDSGKKQQLSRQQDLLIGSLFHSIRTLFKDYLPFVTTHTSETNGILRIRIPIKILYNQGNIKLSPLKRPFINQLLSTMAEHNSNVHLSLEILVGSRPFLNQYEEATSLAIKRITELSTFITKKHFPSHDLELGVQTHFPHDVILTFYAARNE